MSIDPPARFSDRKRQSVARKQSDNRAKSKRMKQLKGYQKRMRDWMPRPEWSLWCILKHWQKPWRPVRQRIIACYLADFCWEQARIVLEVDGPDHEAPKKRWADGKRTEDLNVLGWKVIRVANAEALADPVACCDRIRAMIGGDPMKCLTYPYVSEKPEPDVIPYRIN